MRNFPEIEFDENELNFINRVMKGWQPVNYTVYLDMIIAIIDKQLDRNQYLVTNAVLAVAEAIRFKIFDYRASVEIERMLTDPKAQKPSLVVSITRKNATKAASCFTSNPKAIGPKHRHIIKVLEKQPGLSRREISVATGFLLQTTCGLVHSLVAAGLVYVSGTKFDEKTERTVEILDVVE